MVMMMIVYFGNWQLCHKNEKSTGEGKRNILFSDLTIEIGYREWVLLVNSGPD